MTSFRINPASLNGEPSAYSNGILVKSSEVTLYVSGQIGVDTKGICSTDFESHTRQAWRNIEAILSEAEMTLKDIVKTTIFLVNSTDYPSFAKVRTEVLKGHKPASTLVYVSALVKPEWKVEIDVIASR